MILDHNGTPFANTNGVAQRTKSRGIPDGVAGVEDWFDEMEESITTTAKSRMAHTVLAPMRSQKDVVGDTIANVAMLLESSRPEDVDQNLAQFEVSLFVYASVFAIATNLAQVPLVATRRTRDGDVDEPGSPLQQLVDNPGAGFVTQDELVERYTTYLELAGTSFMFAERQHRDPADPRGKIVEFRPLRPSRIQIMTGDGPGGVERYRHRVAGVETDIHPLNMGVSRLFNPNDDYWGQSPLSVLCRALEIDALSMDWNRNLVRNGGVPDAVAETDSHLGPVVARRIRHRLDQRFGKGKTGGFVVLDDGLKLKNAGFSPKDMEFLALTRVSQHRILSAYGVPPIAIMDLRDASILANAEQQVELFWEATMFPVGRRVANSLTRVVNTDPRFPPGEGWRLRFAWERVESLRKTDEKRERLAREHWQANGITLNEYREEIGKNPLDEGGDVFFRDVQPKPEPNMLSLGLGGKGTSFAVRMRPQQTDEFKALARSTYRAQVRRHEAPFRSALSKFFKEQERRVVSALRKHMNSGAKSHRDSDFADEDLLRSLFDTDAEFEAFKDSVGPVFLGSVVSAGNDKIDQLFSGSSVAALTKDTQRIHDVFESWTATRVVGITNETKSGIRDVLVRSFENASTLSETETDLKSLFRRYRVGGTGPGDTVSSRVERITRTEVATALNTGSFEATKAAQEEGIVILKQWLSSRDDRVRPSHSEMDSFTSAQPIPLDDPFPNGLMHPNDIGGAAEEVINCRCSLIEVVEEES